MGLDRHAVGVRRLPNSPLFQSGGLTAPPALTTRPADVVRVRTRFGLCSSASRPTPEWSSLGRSGVVVLMNTNTIASASLTLADPQPQFASRFPSIPPQLTSPHHSRRRLMLHHASIASPRFASLRPVHAWPSPSQTRPDQPSPDVHPPHNARPQEFVGGPRHARHRPHRQRPVG